MSPFDLALALVLVLSLLRGWQRGAVAVLISWGGLLVAQLLARGLSGPVAARLDERYGWVTRTREAVVAASTAAPGLDAGLPALPALSLLPGATADSLAAMVWKVLITLALFAMVMSLLKLLGAAVTKSLALTPLALPNRLLGATLNLALYGILAGAVCAVALALPGLNPAGLRTSVLAPPLIGAARALLLLLLGEPGGLTSAGL